MQRLGDAITEIERARDAVESADVRTKLDSIAESLNEMIDTAVGEETGDDEAFADASFAGAAASPDNLEELENALAGLAEDSTGEASGHLEAARRHIASVRRRS